MRNHFSDRFPGEVYDLNGAPVVLQRQHAASWGHTWRCAYVERAGGSNVVVLGKSFAIEPGMMERLSWDLLGNVRDGRFIPVEPHDLSVIA